MCALGDPLFNLSTFPGLALWHSMVYTVYRSIFIRTSYEKKFEVQVTKMIFRGNTCLVARKRCGYGNCSCYSSAEAILKQQQTRKPLFIINKVREVYMLPFTVKDPVRVVL